MGDNQPESDTLAEVVEEQEIEDVAKEEEQLEYDEILDENE